MARAPSRGCQWGSGLRVPWCPLGKVGRSVQEELSLDRGHAAKQSACFEDLDAWADTASKHATGRSLRACGRAPHSSNQAQPGLHTLPMWFFVEPTSTPAENYQPSGIRDASFSFLVGLDGPAMPVQICWNQFTARVALVELQSFFRHKPLFCRRRPRDVKHASATARIFIFVDACKGPWFSRLITIL